MEKVRPWCGQPSDRGRLKNRTSLQPEAILFYSKVKMQKAFGDRVPSGPARGSPRPPRPYIWIEADGFAA